MFPKSKIFLYSFLFFTNCIFSQKVEILHQSGFKHDYIIGDLEYIEDINDTSSLKYIATVKATGKTSYWTGFVAYWLDKIQTESKKIGANSFYLEKFTLEDSIGTMVVKAYFASLKFLELNEVKRDKNNIYIFSTFTNMKADSFYLDKNKNYLDPKKYYLLKTELNREYLLAVNPSIVPSKIKFKKEKSSRFFIVPNKKSTLATNKMNRNPSKKDAAVMDGSILGIALYGVAGKILTNVGTNTLIELKYTDGRLMKEIFK